MRRALALIVLLAAAPLALAQDDDDGSSVPGLMSPSGLVLFYNDQGPMAFVSMTPKDIPRDAVLMGDVQGKSCQYGLSIPLSASIHATSISGYAGNGGYRKAIDQIKHSHPDLGGLFDVRVDEQTTSILGFYKRDCVLITAKAFKRQA